MVEHRAFNPWVEGSSPSRPTQKNEEKEIKKMRYRELLEKLSKLDDNQLDDDVTVHLTEIDEFVPVWGAVYDTEGGELDSGHLVLAVVA